MGTPARAGTTPSRWGIGQVIARLSADFPDLTNSKLRFLEEQGLVTPARTASGYRKFSDADVERIRVVLTLQRDRYLPLKVIRQYLADADAGLPVLDATESLSGPAKRTRQELLSDAGASAALLDDATAAGLIPAGEFFDDEALELLRTLVTLAASGIEPRHLRGFRQAAEREADLVESAVRALVRRGDAASRARAEERAGEIAGALGAVRRSTAQRALSALRF